MRKIDKFNASISDEEKIVNDVNRKINDSISLLNKFQMNEVNIIDDMIETIVDYITRERNKEWLKMIEMNIIEQGTKHINYNMIALSARMIYNIKNALMILSGSWADNQREHEFNDSITTQRLWAFRANLSHFAILSMFFEVWCKLNQ